MKFEPVSKFWLKKSSSELESECATLKSWLLASAIVAICGWALFLWRAL